MQRQYWRFYWPLALTGVVTLFGRQFQNGVLARYSDGNRQLAIFALATSVLQLFDSMLAFVPQMANVLARSRSAHRVCFRFLMGVCVVISVPPALLGFTAWGQALTAGIFGLDAATLGPVVLYLRLLTPVILINGMRSYLVGLLVQDRRTGTVTVLNFVYLGVMIGGLLLGLWARWTPIRTMAVAQIASAVLHMALCWVVHLRTSRLSDGRGHVRLTYREALAFFLPVATTSLMFSLSRPTIFAFVNRTADAVVTLAALRVGFDFAMIFQAQVNQLRHLFVTFGDKDRQGVRRFMVYVMWGMTGVMALVAFTPVSTVLLRDLLGVEGRTLTRAGQVLMVLCFTPLVITIRNYYHGRLLTARRTMGMAAGGIFRVASIYAASWLLFRLGGLNHATSAAILQLGFLAEAVVSAGFLRRLTPPPEPAASIPAAQPEALATEAQRPQR